MSVRLVPSLTRCFFSNYFLLPQRLVLPHGGTTVLALNNSELIRKSNREIEPIIIVIAWWTAFSGRHYNGIAIAMFTEHWAEHCLPYRADREDQETLEHFAGWAKWALGDEAKWRDWKWQTEIDRRDWKRQRRLEVMAIISCHCVTFSLSMCFQIKHRTCTKQILPIRFRTAIACRT